MDMPVLTALKEGCIYCFVKWTEYIGEDESEENDNQDTGSSFLAGGVGGSGTNGGQHPLASAAC